MNEAITSTLLQNDSADWYKFNVGAKTSKIEVHMYDAPTEYTFTVYYPNRYDRVVGGEPATRSKTYDGLSNATIKTVFLQNENSVFAGAPENNADTTFYIKFYNKEGAGSLQPNDPRYTFKVNLDSDAQENRNEINSDVYQTAIAEAIGGERMVTGTDGFDINIDHGLQKPSSQTGMIGLAPAMAVEILKEDQLKAVGSTDKVRVLVSGTLHKIHNRRYYTASKYLTDSYWSSPNISGPMTWEQLMAEMPEQPEAGITEGEDKNKYRIDAIRKDDNKNIVLYLHKQRVTLPGGKIKPEYIYVRNSSTRRLRTGFYKIVDDLDVRRSIGSKKQQKKNGIAVKDNVIRAKVANESKAGDDFIWITGEKPTKDDEDAKKDAKDAEEKDKNDKNKKEPEEADATEEPDSDEKEKEKEVDAQPISSGKKLQKIFEQHGEVLVEGNSPFSEDTFVVSAQKKEFTYFEMKEVSKKSDETETKKKDEEEEEKDDDDKKKKEVESEEKKGKTKTVAVKKTGKAWRVKLSKKLRQNLEKGETVSFFIETLTVRWAGINDEYYDVAMNKRARKPKLPPHKRPVDIPDTYFELATVVKSTSELQPALDMLAEWGEGTAFLKPTVYRLEKPLFIYGNARIVAAQKAKIIPGLRFKGKWLIKIADMDDVDKERTKKKFMAKGKSGENVITIQRESNDSRFIKLHEIGKGWKVKAKVGKRNVINGARVDKTISTIKKRPTSP